MRTLLDASPSFRCSRPLPVVRHALGALAALAALSGCNTIPEAGLSGSGRAAPPDTSLATSAQGIDIVYTGYPIPGPTVPSTSPTAAQMAPCISDINAKYTALGGTASVLGASTSAITGYFSLSGVVQCYQLFTSGSIEWSAATGAHEVHGDISGKWANLGYDMSFLALPTTDETVAANNGRYNEFQNGAIYWHGTLGAFALRPEIYAKYKALGAASSRLGYPTNDTGVLDLFPGMFNHFQNGSIYFSTATGPHEVHGPIRDKWAASGWERSYLGYPETDTYDGLVRGGSFTHFLDRFGKHLSIYSSAAGTHSVSGRIREKWASLGWERSVLGYPQTDTSDYDTFGDQTFETGYIFFSNATGAHEVHGSIGRRYWETGQPEFPTDHTYLGFPVSDEIGGLPACKAYGCGLGAKSVFEMGSIYWSPVNGAHDMPRAVEQKLEALGGLTGCMGYPVSNWDASSGVVRFEGGSLTWLPGLGSATGSCYSGTNTGNPGGMTPVCGGASQACCNGTACYWQTDCVSGICRQRASCTSNSDCFGLGHCEGGSCVPCGGTNQTCCWGGSTTEQSCQSGNQCSGSTCTRCGHLNEVCCSNTNLGGLGGQSCSQGHCNGYSCSM